MVKKFKRPKPHRTMNGKNTKQPSHQSTTPPVIKISEAVLRLCEPLRKRYSQTHRIETIIWLTIVAWNISFFPQEEQFNMQERLIKASPKGLTGKDLAVLFENIEMLAERKKMLYPDVREYIVNHEISFSDDMVTLTVGVAPVPELT